MKQQMLGNVIVLLLDTRKNMAQANVKMHILMRRVRSSRPDPVKLQ